MRKRFRNIVSVVGLVLVTLFGLPGGATAEPVPTFYVRVSATTAPYGLAPGFDYTPIRGGLPPGASLIGKAPCSQVYRSGVYGPTTSSYGPNNDGLDPGTYQFVQSSCAPDPDFPLQLDGIGGRYNLALEAGTYTITKAPTQVGGIGLQGPLQGDNTPTPTVLQAVVVSQATENSQLKDKTVDFSVQGSNGVWYRNICSAKTTRTPAGDYVAKCTLSSDYARAMYLSTGVWTAVFNGDTQYDGSSFTGQLKGLTSAADAAKALQAIYDSGTTVVLEQRFVPPECDNNPLAGIQNGSIIEVSVGLLDCSQLEALQITTGIMLAIASIAGSGGQAVLNVASRIAAESAYRALNIGITTFAKWVVVPNPLTPLLSI